MAELAFSRPPTFNHIAISVPAGLLDAHGQERLLRFYSEVFGWTEMPTLSDPGARLVLRAYSNEQFVYLVADPQPMRCPAMDHVGMSVGTPAELDALLERARAWQARDACVEIVDRATEDFGVVKLHSFYVRYLLPLMIEVQCFEWAPGISAASLPPAAG
jgi:hypothetical protein